MALPQLPRSGPRSYLYPRGSGHWHRGIDLPARTGTPVYAVVPGTVTHAVRSHTPGFSGYGRTVVVRIGDVRTLYAHLEDVHVHEGQELRAGDVVGTVGRTCYEADDPSRLCTAPHLHFEVSPRAYPQDSEAPRLDPIVFLETLRAHPLGGAAPAPVPGFATSVLVGFVALVGGVIALVRLRQ